MCVAQNGRAQHVPTKQETDVSARPYGHFQKIILDFLAFGLGCCIFGSAVMGTYSWGKE
jgi:hypothetical protein